MKGVMGAFGLRSRCTSKDCRSSHGPGMEKVGLGGKDIGIYLGADFWG